MLSGIINKELWNLCCLLSCRYITHHGLGGFSGLINGLIAAAIGALSMLMSEPTAESYVKRTCMFVLSIATFTFTFTCIKTLRSGCKESQFYSLPFVQTAPSTY